MKFHPLIALLALFLLALPPHILKLPQVLGELLQSDRQALLDFAAAFPHTPKLKWNETAPLCTSWVGITCDANATNVVALRLPGVGLSGSIPPNTIGKLHALKVLSLRSNLLTGNLPADIPSLPSLRGLFLQFNNFSGALPSSLSPSLNVLDLSHNSFTGTIPSTLGNLTRLAVLNLQSNSLSGPIPSLNLPATTTLKVLNLSYNHLNGSIPDSLKRFPSSSFLGNPLSVSSSPSPSPSPSPLDDLPNPPSSSVSESRHAATPPRTKLGAASIIAIVIGCLAAFVFLLLVAILLVWCVKRKAGSGMVKRKASGGGKSSHEKPNDFGSGVQEAEKNKLFFFQGCSYNFDLEDLLKASAEVLGKGSYGTTYKASLEEGTQVVVKRLKEAGVGKREFEQHMEALDRTIGRHPNIVPLRAYYYSKDEKLLVYNYMPAGSLFSLLHGNRSGGRTPLDWDTRMKIALGTAQGIAHIHSEGGAKCSHGNIKSSNVLLTDELEACVSDVGLAQLMNTPVTMSRVAGYRAPEVIETRKVTQKSDVYSFGVLVLEMLTAKAPLQQGVGHDEVIDLPRWVRSVVREEWTAEVFDVELLRFQSYQEEMVQMLQIALACVARTPDMRPKMDEVVRMIEDIRQSESKNRTSSEAESNIQTP